MRMKTKKRAAYDRQWRKPRNDYLEQHSTCMICTVNTSTAIHEINSGPLRRQAYREPATWLALCVDCHRLVHDTPDWPVARQLALKFVRDNVNFDLEKVNEQRRGCKPMISMEEIVMYFDVY